MHYLNLLLISFIVEICAFSTFSTGSSNGAFKDAIFNPKRNEYFWKTNTNILPIIQNKAITICNGWRICHIDKDSIPKKKYTEFIKKTDEKSSLCYKWVPLNDKSDVRGLITLSIDNETRQVFIKKILPNPYIKSFEIDLLKSDLDQIKLQDGFKDYVVNYDLFEDENNHLSN